MKELYLGRLSILLSWCLINATSRRQFYSVELTPAQKVQVQDGSQVVITEDIGKAVAAHQGLPADQCHARAGDRRFFRLRKRQVLCSNVIKSQIANKLSACTMDVDYGLDVPIFPTSSTPSATV